MRSVDPEARLEQRISARRSATNRARTRHSYGLDGLGSPARCHLGMCVSIPFELPPSLLPAPTNLCSAAALTIYTFGPMASCSGSGTMSEGSRWPNDSAEKRKMQWMAQAAAGGWRKEVEEGRRGKESGRKKTIHRRTRPFCVVRGHFAWQVQTERSTDRGGLALAHRRPCVFAPPRDRRNSRQISAFLRAYTCFLLLPAAPNVPDSGRRSPHPGHCTASESALICPAR